MSSTKIGRIKKTLGFIFLGLFIVSVIVTIILASFDKTISSNIPYAYRPVYRNASEIIIMTLFFSLPLSLILLGKKIVRIIGGILLVIMLFPTLTLTFYLRPFKIAGSAMSPRFLNQEFYLVNKRAYDLSSPKRGDVVYFTEEGTNRIARVVGLPGEKITVKREGKVLVNGEPLSEPYASWNYWNVKEDLNFNLTKDSYLLMNDQRRSFYSILTVKDIKGKFWFRYWPSSKMGFVN